MAVSGVVLFSYNAYMPENSSEMDYVVFASLKWGNKKQNQLLAFFVENYGDS